MCQTILCPQRTDILTEKDRVKLVSNFHSILQPNAKKELILEGVVRMNQNDGQMENVFENFPPSR